MREINVIKNTYTIRKQTKMCAVDSCSTSIVVITLGFSLEIVR